MTGSSGRAFSVSEALFPLAARDLHLWLYRRAGAATDSDRFRRELLSRYAPVAPKDWRFRLGENGKPALVDPPRALQFNISDSGQWIACAVTAVADIGVDLEYCDPQRDVSKLARRFFQPHEVAALQVCCEARRRGRFYDYWTLKEARIKSAGGSLGREVEGIGFELNYPPREPAAGTITAAFDVSAAFEYYCLLEPVPAYRLALCCLSPVIFSPRLRLFELLADGAVREFWAPLRAVGNAVAGKARAGS